jgi:hypothetical protein
VPAQGDYSFHFNTSNSIESNAATFIPEWKNPIMLEEEIYFDQSKVNYLDGCQPRFYLIKLE